MNINPYRRLPRKALWARSVTANFDAIDMIDGGKMICIGEKVVSAGSCFAANLVPFLEKSGLTYYRTEPQHAAFQAAEPENFGYAKFSAAYGNIYTPRQLLQLLRRARGQFKPVEDRWMGDGLVRDALRPALKYPSRNNTEFDIITLQHLNNVLEAFSNADVFIFTLGLTEAWISNIDGTVYPACPGTIAGKFDPERHVFKNFSVDEIVEDLKSFISELREINKNIRVILTVSPVPLVATVSGDHALSATTYSKSVLRVAAEIVRRDVRDVIYFPSYEIITGPQAPYEYFEPDRRSVTEQGIATVMRAFLAHCETAAEIVLKEDKIQPTAASLIEAECEEEMVARG
ncbi:GSCFA domain-containing protein [Sphingobium yanoikuyae]|uniref:GSCFA domain-containing protein n=1 Tax=Sphingobium yanoikuyae TaxID=13690 RepID=UPI0035B277AC